MNYRRTRAVFVKELRHIVRDKRSLALALAMPAMMLLLYGFALSLDVDHVPIAVFDQDGSAASRSLERQFRGSRYFDVKEDVRDYRALDRAVDVNEVLMGIVIPRGFGQDLARGRGAQVQLLVDGSDSNTASIASAYAEGVIALFSAEVTAEVLNRRGVKPSPAVAAQPRVWYNSSLQSRNFVVPGLIAIILMTLTGQLTTLTVAREWEMGTMEHMLSTPLRPAEIVLGKMLAYFLVGLADAAMAFGAGLYIFDVPFRGDVWLLAGSTFLFLFCAMFWGVYISAGSRTQVEAFQAGMLTTFLPGFLLSGFVFAIDTMPKWIQAVSVVVPSRYFMTILKALFLKGVGLHVLWPQFVSMALFAGAVFWLAVRRLDQKVA